MTLLNDPLRSQLELRSLLDTILALRADVLTAEADWAELLEQVDPAHAASARNLTHYLALRQHDLRPLQLELSRRSLSSLGRCEPHVLGSLDALVAVLTALVQSAGDTASGLPAGSDGHEHVAFVEGPARLAANADALLGKAPSRRSSRIMVTMPSDAATDAGLVEGLLLAGMDVARINCAHDDPAAWRQMARHVRDAASCRGLTCKIAMDLAGPKLRTGELMPGPAVLRVAPARDERGVVVAPALVWFTTDDEPAPPGAVRVPISDATWAARRQPDDIVRVTDCRGADRKLCVIDAGPTGCLATLRSTTYLEPGLRLRAGDDIATIGALPSRRAFIELHIGDTLTVTADPGPQDSGVRPPRIGCTLDAVFTAARPGERILFDDGKIGGVIIGVDPAEIRAEITYARPKGSKLRGEKGINLPDTNLDVAAITLQDEFDLATAVTLADVVQASFVRTAADVERLQETLARLGGEHLGIVLKIETVAGFENLPEIVLTALRSRRVGVMIARGDLAVEAGYERLAEVQEEILWLCEAAHVPVIWATEVLDLLAGGGRPSRAEVSDAALSGRAECVMLNKGPHIEAAITTLDDILVRMHSHQQKKRSLLRRLRAWDHDPP